MLSHSKIFSRYLLPALLIGTATAAQALTWTQITPATSPPNRSYLAMAYDAVSKKVVVFGGFSGTGYLNDTWTFDGTTWTQVQTAVAPPARSNGQMAYDRH